MKCEKPTFTNIVDICSIAKKALLRHGLLIFCAGLLCLPAAIAQTTFTASISGNWTTIAWSKTGTPSSATYPGETGYESEIHDVVVNGAAITVTLNANILTSIRNVTLTNGTLALTSGTLTISGSLSGAGTLTFTTGNLNIAGDNTSSGTLTSGTGTMNYNGVNQIVRSSSAVDSYYNLNISGSGIKTLSNSALTINNNLGISGASMAFSDIAAQTVTVGGDLSGDGTIDMSSGNLTHLINLGGTNNTIGVLISAAAGSTVNYNRNGDQQVFASSGYRNIVFGTGGIKTAQGDITAGGSVSITASTFNFGTSDKVVTVNANFSLNSGGLDMSGSGNNKLFLRGASNTYTAGTFTPGISSQLVTYDGDLAQTIMPLTYRNLTIGNNNIGSVTARTKTQSGVIIVNGELNIEGNSTSITTFQLGNFNFTVNGSTNIKDFGQISDINSNVNIFAGVVVVSANGRWNIPVSCTFRGGLTVDSPTFITGGTYTFDTNNQIISGAASITLTSVASATAGITLTNANTNGLTITGTLSGAGNFSNGTSSDAAILYLTSNGNPLTLTGVLDLISNPNTVNYNGTGAQTIIAKDFNNLTISGSRSANITLVNGGTIRISGAFSPIATFSSGNYLSTGNTIELNGVDAQSIPSLGTASYNNITISGGSVKTLVGNVTLGVNGVLNMNGGILELDDYNLTVSNNSAAAIVPVIAYSSSNMISTNGTGYLEKSGNTAASLQIVYPVGSGGFFSPMTITDRGTAAITYIRVRAVPTAINPSYITKYWDVTADAGLVNATATFEYDPAESNGASSSISYSPNSGTSWQNPPSSGSSSFGANSFTITGTSPFNGWWTMGYRSFYSYQTGDWNTATTWTSDPSGTLQLGNTIPGVNDKVVILSDRTVSVNADISSAAIDLTINESGYLNMNTFSFTSGLKTLQGQGTLQLASAIFPASVVNTFINTGGGTTEYNANINLPIGQTVYNNLKINTSGSVVQLNNLLLNGSLEVVRGTLQINDNSPVRRQLNIAGNVTVAAGASITVGTGVTNSTSIPTGIATTTGAPFIDYYDSHSHRIVVMGDFTNNGTVRFTNLTFPVYNVFPPTVNGLTTGFATVYFRGNTNNTLTCNGITDFYNLVLDKGIDQSYSLTINSDNYGNFRLFGANIAGGDVTAPATASNPNLKKALWIRTGTLILEGSTVIPSLSEGNNAAASALNYIIPANGALILNGTDVIVQSTADLYQEVNAAYGVSGGTGNVNGVIGGPEESGILVLGKLEVNNGYLSTKESRGILYNSTISGQIFINGGTVDAKQFRSLTPGTGLVAFTQSGGILILRGRFQRIPSAYASASDLSNAAISTVRLNDAALLATAGSFSIENTSDVFTMSGGIISIYDVPSPGATGRAYDILTSQANFNVTGGLLSLFPSTGTGGSADTPLWLLSSSSPLANMDINRASGATAVQLNIGYPLTVLNNLNLQSGVFLSNGQDLTIGGNFSIASGTTYTPGTNTTVFNGSGSQTFTIDLAAPLLLNNLRVDKPVSETLVISGSQPVMNVAGTLSLIDGTLNDNGKTINITGNVYNSGVHTGTGKLSMSGITAAQTIDGNGSGVFQNLELNNSNATPVALLNDATVNGTLTFSQDRVFDISTHNLRLNSTSSVAGAGLLRYIKTSGTLGDGGLTKSYSSPSAFTFPVGVINYSPGSIGLSGAPSAYGSITIVPVNYAHPNVTATGRSLSYFWRVKSSGFILGAATVTHGYTYNDVNVVTGSGITETEYVAAVYNPVTFTWSRGSAADVDETANIIGEPGGGNFLENKNFIDGDFTAGDDIPTNPFGTPAIYYSRQSGTWGTQANWSLTSHTVTNPPASAPGAGDIVIIGNNHVIAFETPVLVLPDTYQNTPNSSPHSCASLQIETGAVLDIRFNPASTFSMVRSHPNGNGTIRVACDYDSWTTFVFPGGDFSDFNQNLGTTELYSTNPNPGTTYWLPNNITSYGNLIISPLGGSNIIFGNTNITIYGNLITRGEDSRSWFCPTWNSNYPTAPTARTAKTISVLGDFRIEGGALIYYGNNNLAQNFIINGDLFINDHAGLKIYSNANNQSFSIGGSLISNSLPPGGGIAAYRGTNFTGIPITFFGDTDASVTNTNTLLSPELILGQVTINKGTSQSTLLTVDIGGTLTTPLTNWLTLKNGTLRYMRVNPAAGADFTISTNTAFNIPSTAGLYIDYANTNNVNILIGSASNNNGDLLLSGKLTVIRGNVYVGPVLSPDNHNDIEYSGSGASEIDIKGGTLTVNGNIRRSGTSGGILRYSQSGSSSAKINGRGSLVTNAKLEILNAGSIFNMSGTSTLTIVRGGGTSAFGDFYLRPEASSVTGGTIFLQTVADITAAEETFKIDASVPINSLVIRGLAGDAAKGSLSVNPLVLKGDLTIENTFSSLATNNLNVTIGGNLTNSGTYNYSTNTTLFNGSIQSVLGTSVTNFYNLEVSPVTSLTTTLNSYTAFNNLVINSGILVLNNKLLTVLGHFTNNGTYTDDNSSGGVTLGPGTSFLQQISGSGSFGRLILNNNAGARLLSSISLQNNLVLTAGILDINQHQLTLGFLSNIIGNPGFSLSNMVLSDGVASSSGVRKFFPVITATTEFIFPIGVSGKYTPATYNINAIGTAGYININPINTNHPAVTNPASVLKYYWQIESSGISAFDGTLALKYMSGDVQGVESDYVATRLLVPGTYWSKATPGSATDNVDELQKLINFYIPAGTNNLSGDYTAGTDDAISDEVPTYVSNRNGNWSDETIWTPVGSSPACPVGGPNGFIVTVDHVVTIGNNFSSAYRATINNKLRILSPTFGHNLGLVDGTGTLYLEGPNLPAGNFNSFLDCSTGGTLEYGGAGNYTIVASQYNSVPNLFFTGSGTRTLPNKDLTICNRLVIDGPILDNTASNRALIILGTMERYNTGAFRAGTGATAKVTFQGTSAQTIGGASGDFNGANRFNNLEINNSAGLTLNGLIELGRNLLLTNGIITTTATNILYINNTLAACVLPAGGSASSFVNGPLRKIITNGTNFVFPVGSGNTLGHPLTLTNSSGATNRWNVSYSIPNSTASSYLAPLQAVNPEEFWSINVPFGSLSARVKIGWDSNSAITPFMTLNGITDMRVAEFSGGNWNEKLSVTSGDATLGDVETSGIVTITTTAKDYSTGSVTTLIPRASLAPTGPVCGPVGIPVKFTSSIVIPLNYTLDYTIDGISQASIIVNSLPYTLPTPVAGVYVLTGFKYNNGASTGVVDNTPVIAYTVPTVSNAGPDQSLCGLSNATLAGNNPGGFSGLWTKISGSGGAFLAPGSYNSGFIGLAGNTYVLQWTISSGTCRSSDNVTIAFPVAPQRPSAFTSAPAFVCQGGSGYIYTVPNVPGTTYSWTYSGTGQTIIGSGNSVTINFNSTATGGTLSVTATNGCGTSAPRSVAITVNPLPTITSTTPGSVCGTGSVTLGATASAGTVNWYSAPTGGASLGTGTSFVTPVISSTTTFYAGAINNGCATLTRSAVIATVNAVPNAPSPGIITQPTCAVSTGSVVLNLLPAGNWTINPGGIPGNNASTTITGLSQGIYIYTVTNSLGCTSLPSSNVVINAQPTAPAAATASTTIQPTCAVATGTITVSAPLGAGYQYNIDGGAYQLSPVFASLSSGPHTILVRSTTDLTCISAPTIVTVNAQPTPPAAATASTTLQPTCSVATGTITISAPLGAGYQYNIDGGTYQLSPVFAGVSAGPHTILVRSTTDLTCISAPTIVTVNAQPTPPAAATASTTIQPTCAIATGTITISAPLGAGYQYNIDGGAYQLSPVFASLSSGPHTILVRSTTDLTCISVPTIVTVNAQPTAPAAATASTTIQPTCAIATGTITISAPLGAGYQYNIDGGAYQLSPVFAGVSSGPHTILVRSTTDLTCISAPTIVTVNAQPTAPAAATASTTIQPTCSVATGTITVSAPLGAGYQYNIDGGTYQLSPVFAGVTSGPHTILVRSTTDLTCISSPTIVTVNAQPTAPAAATASTIIQPTCSVATGTITVSAPLGAGYQYNIDGGAYQLSPVFASLSSGPHTILVRSTTDLTCISTPTVVTVSVQPTSPAAATASTTIQPTCAIATGTITVSAPLGAGYQYNIDGGVYQLSPVFAGVTSGPHTILVRSTTDLTCISSPTVVAVNAQPTAPAAATASTTIQPTCAVATGTITVSAPLGAGYQYNIDGGAYQLSPVFASLSSGPHTILVRSTTDLTCISAPTVVTVNVQPTAPAAATASTTIQPTCAIATGTITVSAPLGAGYQYNIDGGTYQLSPVFAGVSSGPHTILVRSTTDLTCISAPTVVTVNAQPTAPAAATASTTLQPICAVATGTITVSAPLGAGYQYNIDGGAYQLSPVFASLSSGPHTILVRSTTDLTCISAPTIVIVNAQPTAPAASTASTTLQPTCAVATGTITVSAPLGAGYQYNIDGGAYQLSPVFASLSSGPHTILVRSTTDLTCISSPTIVTVNAQPTAPAAATASTTIQPTCAVATGTITVSAPLGAGYQYNIDGGAYQLSPVFAGLSSGPHTILVRSTTDLTCISSPTIVTVNAQPIVPVAATATTTIQPNCTVATGTITVSSPIGVGYEYNIDGGIYQLLPVFAGLSPGPHTIIVRRTTDLTCVSAPTVVTVSAPPSAPTVIITSPGAVCSPATVDLTSSSVTSGSTAGLTYTYWSDAAATVPYSTPSGATSGTYYIKGTAVSGCYDVKPVLVTVHPTPSITGTQVNVLCFGGSNGSIDITVTTGTAPFIYAWTGTGVMPSAQDQTGLSAGIYSVIVTDSRSCISSSTSFTITQPSILSGTITSQTNVSVFGGNDGSLTAAGSGGTSPYLYKLGTGAYQASGTFGSLTAGSYTITIQDNNLCTFNVVADITQPTSSVSGTIVSKSDVLCFGGATGSITVAGSGGKAPYEYKLDLGNYQLTGTFGSLSAGSHKITIRDALLVTFDLNFTITQPATAVGGTVITQTNVQCFGRSSGSVTIGGSGGIAPYKYKLGSGVYQNSGTFGSLAAGSHTLTVQDANLCTFTIQAVITEPQDLAISAVREDVSCPGVSDGKISLTITGGTSPYQVLWSDGVTTLDRQNLSAGTYSVVVTDRNGCASSLNIVVAYIGSETCLEIQEIITPNNDGFYDKWKIRNIELFPNAEVQVFNRWGKRVFSTKNISANEWDGTFNGELQPTDSYHYILYLNDGSEPRSGVVSIIR